MQFLKKYPLFIAWIVLCVAVLAIGVWQIQNAREAVNEAETALDRSVQEARSVAGGIRVEELDESIFPSRENLDLLKERLAEYRQELYRIEAEFEPEEDILGETTVTESNFLPRILGFISRYTSLAERYRVELNRNESFGFSAFAVTARNPPDRFLPVIDKQRRILEYLLTQLYESRPRSIIYIRREAVETAGMSEQNARTYTNRLEDVFTVDPRLSASGGTAPVETLGFEFRFRGDTRSLREFLNRLAQFELPVVVRDIRVDPVEPDRAPARETARRGQAADFMELFGGAAEAEEEVDPSQIPVITQNESIFTVVLEYIEIASEEDEDEPTDQT